MNRAYSPVLLSELQSNYWNFSITRAVLAAAAIAPAFGPAYYYPLSPDFIMLAPPDQINVYPFGDVNAPYASAQSNQNNPSNISTPNTSIQYNDWEVELAPGIGPCIATNQPGPLYVRYVSSSVTESMFDPLFAEAFAAALGMETCEELTQSNSKLTAIETLYKDTMETAKKRNAFQNKPVRPPVDSWILSRL